MNKIVSRFYLIRLSGEPVYVGYTNRTIKQRFSEHKHDKDFGDIEPTVESLGKLEYDFTWDMDLINQYAREVSDRETELIEEYGTQDSVLQKGLMGTLVVRRGMMSSILLKLIEITLSLENYQRKLFWLIWRTAIKYLNTYRVLCII